MVICSLNCALRVLKNVACTRVPFPSFLHRCIFRWWCTCGTILFRCSLCLGACKPSAEGNLHVVSNFSQHFKCISQNLQYDCVVLSGACSQALTGHSGMVVRRCVLLASLKLCKTFQPPRCAKGLAAFEAAVDVLSDVHVHPSGQSVAHHMSP